MVKDPSLQFLYSVIRSIQISCVIASYEVPKAKGGTLTGDDTYRSNQSIS